MDCHDNRSLRRKYALYLRAYSEALGKLVAVSSLATRSEWDLAWDLAGRAQASMRRDAQSTASTHRRARLLIHVEADR